MTNKEGTVESDDLKIRRVAKAIQELLVKEQMAIIPQLSLQIVADKAPGIIATPESQLLTPDQVPDFMQ